MTLFAHEKAPLHIPIYGTDEIADASGAGDSDCDIRQPWRAAPEYAARPPIRRRPCSDSTATATCDELRAAVQRGL
jgi:hypothetical protein